MERQQSKEVLLAGRLQSPVLLLIRLTLAYGFLTPALNKLSDITAIADWFRELGIPFPLAQAWLSALTEISGSVLLALGLATRLISLPLIIVMVVAIATVHLHNGFETGNNGFEIPLYYILMLMVLITNGGGRFSLDHLIRRQRQRQVSFPASAPNPNTYE